MLLWSLLSVLSQLSAGQKHQTHPTETAHQGSSTPWTQSRYILLCRLKCRRALKLREGGRGKIQLQSSRLYIYLCRLVSRSLVLELSSRKKKIKNCQINNMTTSIGTLLVEKFPLKLTIVIQSQKNNSKWCVPFKFHLKGSQVPIMRK